MKFLQKLGKALMLPVAVLPICGILMGIGYRLCPATMQGGEISGAVNLIGLFLVKAGAALIDNMAILFAIGVGVGMSEKNDGTGGIAALASWPVSSDLPAITVSKTPSFRTGYPSSAANAVQQLFPVLFLSLYLLFCYWYGHYCSVLWQQLVNLLSALMLSVPVSMHS